MKNVTTIYKKTMKMSDIIEADYQLLLLLDKLKISLGFSEKSVETVCRENNFDSNCFIFLANLQSNKQITNVEEEFDKLPLEPFIIYLKGSHNYFLEKRLPNIRKLLEELFNIENQELRNIVLNFFDKYTKEVLEHMNYEDNVVFPYVDTLIKNNDGEKYSIDIFEEVHTDIEGKMNDLIQILMKYLHHISHQTLVTNILLELYVTREELEAHRFIEDILVIPRVRKIEKKLESNHKP